jgi:hypothetical protein
VILDFLLDPRLGGILAIADAKGPDADPKVYLDVSISAVRKKLVFYRAKRLLPEPDMHTCGARLGSVIDVREPISTPGVGFLVSPKDDPFKR